MKFPRSLVLLAGATLLLCHSAAFAGINAWTLGGPEGGQATAVAVDPTDPAILLASMGNGLYRSTDAGATWTYRADVFSAYALIIDPSKPLRVFALRGEGRIFRSDDGGATFTKLNDPPNFSSSGHITIASDGTLYVADERASLYKSVNAGTDWTVLTFPWTIVDSAGGAIAVDPANANTVLVGIRGVGTYRSADGGATWTPLPIANSPGTHSGTERVLDIAFKPGSSTCVVASSDSGIQVSNDGGLTWSAPGASSSFAVAFDPLTPANVVSVDTLGYVWRSTNSGTSWTRGADLHMLPPLDLAFGAGHRALLAGPDGPMVSDDGGVTFTLKISGILSQSVRDFERGAYGVNFAALSAPFGIFDLTTLWTPVDNDALRASLDFYPTITTFSFAPNNPNWIHAVGSLNSFVSSFDKGKTWTQPLLPFQSGSNGISHVVVDWLDGKIVYLVMESGDIWRSEDNGFNFAKRSTGLPAGISAMAIDPANSAVLYVGDAASPGSGIWKSVDSGVTWAPLGTTTLGTAPVNAIVVDQGDSRVVYASLRDGLHRSTDGGVTWTFSGPPNFAAYDVIVDPAYPHTILYGGSAGSAGSTAFARSVDDGQHWQTVPSAPVHPTLGGFDRITFARGFGIVWAGGIGTGLHQYQISTDLSVELGPVPAEIALNATGQFTVTVRNLGPFDAAAPTLDINVPASTTVATTPTGCVIFQDVFRCVLPGLRNGQSQTITMDYKAVATLTGGTLGATIVSREYDAAYTNNAAAATIWAKPITDLRVTSTATAAVLTNAPITFTATVTNAGPNDSTTTQYSLLAPAGVTVQTATSTVGTCTTAAQQITCDLGAFANGASATITVSATGTQVGNMSWASSVTGPAEDPVATNNTATSTTNVTAPPPPPAPSSGGKKGGGRLEWLTLLALGAALALRRRWRPATAG